MRTTVELIADGRRIPAMKGTTVAAALLDAGVRGFRRSIGGEPRGPLCGMGICFECRVTIDDVPHRRACLVPVADGMRVSTGEDEGTARRPVARMTNGATWPATRPAQALTADIVVVGAGPAGIAAAVAAERGGRRVVLLDAGLTPGGQIWRHAPGSAPPREARELIGRLTASSVTMLLGTSVVEVRCADPGGGGGGAFVVLGEGAGRPCRVEARAVVLATGARELFLPFPGWTLPGVVGVGGAQALLKMGSSVAGRRVVVAGTGPLLLPVAASLARAGARLTLVAEQANRRAVVRFGASLWRRPGLVLRATRYRAAFARTRYVTGRWVVAAEGDGRIQRVTVTDGRNAGGHTLDCDLLCVAYGLVPNTELARLVGCTMVRGTVVVDERQQTSITGVYCAGEPTGVGGADLALVEGEIAGFAAAGETVIPARLFATRERLRTAAAAMERAFSPRVELRRACTEDTIVCRCEDVPRRALEPQGSSRQAKLYTRAGMGACQGRICGSALEFLSGWTPDSVRAPIEPTLLSTFLTDDASPSPTTHCDVPTLQQGAI